MRPIGSPKTLQQRRQRAIELLTQGYQPVEVAKALGVDRRSVRRWKSQYRAQGQTGIQAKPVPGRPAKRTSQHLERLEKKLLKGAKAAGFETDLWTCPRIACVINEKFGVSYHVDHIGRLLHFLGWSPQKPERRALERNEQQIRTWKRIHWPRIKKKPSD